MNFPSIQEVDLADLDRLARWYRWLLPETQEQEVIWTRIAERCYEMGVFNAEFRQRARTATAIREAGHAVVALQLGLKVTNVRILSDEEGECNTLEPSSQDEKQGLVVCTLAGQWAEAQFASGAFRRLGSRKDEEDVANLLNEICWGQPASHRTRMSDELHTRAVEQVENLKEGIWRVAGALRRAGELTGGRVSQIMHSNRNKSR